MIVGTLLLQTVIVAHSSFDTKPQDHNKMIGNVGNFSEPVLRVQRSLTSNLFLPTSKRCSPVQAHRTKHTLVSLA